ncbi:MAG: hypoxanthine phosphoribosyltransferase [Oscillospiraceae bacterium]|nr:hypoxanthine phosphoribosyltransferase [Oscillospiraceae bacterium]
MSHYINDLEYVLIDETEIAEVVARLAGEINSKFTDKLLVVGILKGAFVFMSDLIRKLTIPIQIDFMRVKSYGSGSKSSGKPEFKLDLESDLTSADVLIVEDIIDSGRTLKELTSYFKSRGAKSVTTCVLLDKPDRREVEYIPDFTGKSIPDVFVVGYGLDYSEKYRELPYIGVLKQSEYKI